MCLCRDVRCDARCVRRAGGHDAAAAVRFLSASRLAGESPTRVAAGARSPRRTEVSPQMLASTAPGPAQLAAKGTTTSFPGRRVYEPAKGKLVQHNDGQSQPKAGSTQSRIAEQEGEAKHFRSGWRTCALSRLGFLAPLPFASHFFRGMTSREDERRRFFFLRCCFLAAGRIRAPQVPSP